MGLEELFKKLLHSFFVIVTGILASILFFCLIFYPDFSFSLKDIGRIFLMALASDLPLVIFYSRNEISKRQMVIRYVILLFVLLSILTYFAHLWDWVELDKPKEVLVFVALVMGVYAIVMATMAYQDKKLSDKLNNGLKRRYPSD